MIAQRLSSCKPGLYKVVCGHYLLFKMDSKRVRRINHREEEVQEVVRINRKEQFLDIEDYNHVFVKEIPLIALLKRAKQLHKERRHDSQATQANHRILLPSYNQQGSCCSAER